jgi:Holliday junction resolvase-like predicted endonuclease
VGWLGERVAERFLVSRGALVLGRNVVVGRGEVDLHVRLDGQTVVAVEVKTVVRGPASADPREHFDDAKARQVWRLARELEPPARRVDLVAVTLDSFGAEVRWLRHAS